MIIQYLGKKNVNFTNQQGQQVTGNKLYYGYEDTNVDGLAAGEKFVRDTIVIPPVKVGEKLNCEFDGNGKIRGLAKA